MLEKVKQIKLIIQDDRERVIVFSAKKNNHWQIPTRRIRAGEFPEEAVEALVIRVLPEERMNYRLLKVVETSQAELHVYLTRMDGRYHGEKPSRSVRPVELTELAMNEANRLVVRHFAKTFYGGW